MAERRVYPPKPGGAGEDRRAVRIARTNARAVPPAANDNRLGRRGLAIIVTLLAAFLALVLLFIHAAA